MERFGQYILLDKVGSGGMAELFKAKKLGIEGFERVLAIKRILPHLSSDDEFIDMFIAEAKLVARLNNKNIVQVYDFGLIGQNYFISMEYIRGKDLRSILKRCKEKKIDFPVQMAVFIAKEVASALHHAHNQKDSTGMSLGIIHRDVSPQNILISYEGEVKVVDFGIAKAGAHSKTTTGVLKGKLSYMSPEQAWGKPIDHRSDIFSLGIVMYEMLTGERLFKGDSEINTLERVREAKVEPMPSTVNADLPPDLEARLLKTLARETSDRYQTAAEMEAEFGEILFQMLHGDPVVSLKQFMHKLFRQEIEAEHRSEMEEETVSVQFEDEPGQAEQRSFRTGTVRAAAVRKKKKIYPYALAGVAAILMIAGYMFWPAMPEKTSLPLSDSVSRPIKPENQAPPSENTTVGTLKEENKISVPADEKKQDTAVPVSSGEGGLNVNAVPWAKIYINGNAYGTTPKTIDNLKPGTYKVKLENPGFPSWETSVRISKNEVAKISHKFGGFGKVTINASPWGNVYIDGSLKGQTPLTLEKVPAGRHKIKIEREGFVEASKTVEINEGATEQVSFSLQKEGE